METSEIPKLQRRKRVHFWARVLVVTVLVAMLCGIAHWYTAQAVEARQQNQTMMAFKLVGNSLRLYDGLFGHLPYPIRFETPGRVTERGMANGNGKPLYSWRAEVAELADNWWAGRPWDQSRTWNDTANRQIACFPWRYSYGALGLDDYGRLPSEFSPETNVMAITGLGTPFGYEGQPPASLSSLDNDTILVVETRNSGVHWMQPGDYNIRDMPRTINAPNGRGISSRLRRGFHVLFADGQVWFLSNETPFAALEKFFTVNGAKCASRDKLLQRFRIGENR